MITCWTNFDIAEKSRSTSPSLFISIASACCCCYVIRDYNILSRSNINFSVLQCLWWRKHRRKIKLIKFILWKKTHLKKTIVENCWKGWHCKCSCMLSWVNRESFSFNNQNVYWRNKLRKNKIIPQTDKIFQQAPIQLYWTKLSFNQRFSFEFLF